MTLMPPRTRAKTGSRSRCAFAFSTELSTWRCAGFGDEHAGHAASCAEIARCATACCATASSGVRRVKFRPSQRRTRCDELPLCSQRRPSRRRAASADRPAARRPPRRPPRRRPRRRQRPQPPPGTRQQTTTTATMTERARRCAEPSLRRPPYPHIAACALRANRCVVLLRSWPRTHCRLPVFYWRFHMPRSRDCRATSSSSSSSPRCRTCRRCRRRCRRCRRRMLRLQTRRSPVPRRSSCTTTTSTCAAAPCQLVPAMPAEVASNTYDIAC